MSVKLFDHVFSLFEPEKKSSPGAARVFLCVVQGLVLVGHAAQELREAAVSSRFIQRLFISFFFNFFFKFSFSLIHVR